MFVARASELAFLEERYESATFQMIPIWGRRRVGKTTLLNRFCTGKQWVHFFSARRTSAAENLAGLSSSVLAWYDPQEIVRASLDGPTFPSFEAALAHVFEEARNERVVMVIDEYPYLAASYPAISSLLQSLIDTYRDSCRLMLVLCGSSMSFMEHQVLGESSPLYGRRTGQLKVEPFDYTDAASLLAAPSPERAVELFSLVGGVPLYLEQLDASHTPEWNLARRMLGTGEFLYAEPENFLLQELASPAPYHAIIGAIAGGHPRPSEIADATGIAAPNVNEHLRRLSELGIVERVTPVGRAHRRRVRYTLSDALFRFWYRFVPRYQQAIELGQSASVARQIVSHDLDAYVGHAFEDVCRQWVARAFAAGTLDFLPSRIGRWWGTDPTAREQADVDVVALGADGELVCGECKWTARPVTAAELDVLARRAALVTAHPSRLMLLVFSKSGFAASAQRAADALGNVRLVSLDELFEARG